MMQVLYIIAWLVSGYLIADLISGITHWWMDRYGKEEMPIVGPAVVEINTMHHANPRRMISRSYWYLSKSAWVFSWGICGIWYLVFDNLPWQMILVAVVGSNGNIVHQWTHMFENEKPRIVTWMQKLRIIQNPAQHATHHTKPEERAYCIITPWLNPILDKTRFWLRLENIIEYLFGVPPNTRLQDLNN